MKIRGGKRNPTGILLEQRVFDSLVWSATVKKGFHFHAGESWKAEKTW